jgi:hypothetical protein
MSVPPTTHTLTIYHSHTHPRQPHLPITHSPLTAHTQFTSHTLTHVSPSYHSHNHLYQSHLPRTHSSFTTHTHIHVGPTYHSHNYPCQPHISLIHSFVEYDVAWFVEYVLVFQGDLVLLLPWKSRAEGTGSFLSDISAYRGRRAVTGNDIHSHISLFQN